MQGQWQYSSQDCSIQQMAYLGETIYNWVTMRPEGNRLVQQKTELGMRCLTLVLILGPVLLLGQPQNDPSPDLDQESISTFQDQILPILQTRCLGCHSRKVRSGGLSLSRIGRTRSVEGAAVQRLSPGSPIRVD